MEYSEKVYTIDELKQYLKKIIEENNPEVEELILFGSYARGEATPISDLDLYIRKPDKVLPRTVYTLTGRIKENLFKYVELFRASDVDHNSEFYKNILKDGMIIYEKDNAE